MLCLGRREVNDGHPRPVAAGAAGDGLCYHRLTVDALTQFLEQFKRVNNAIVDSYFVVDNERRIVDFNRAFYAMLPRQVARGLKGKKCFEVIELNICKNECIAQQCWKDNRPVRLDEISGKILGDSDSKELRFILSAVPITDEHGNHVGALEIQRNVTDEAVVQVKYQEMLETEARERERLANQIRARTKELLETNQLLLKTQKELLAYKKGLSA
jgi:PAS domain-containing protein